MPDINSKKNLTNGGILSFAVNQEKCIDNIFKKLEETRRSLTPSATRPGIMHGLCKIY